MELIIIICWTSCTVLNFWLFCKSSRDCPIGRIMRLARPNVCLSHTDSTRKQSKAEQSKLAQTFLMAGVSVVPVFSFRGQRSRSHDVKTYKNLAWDHVIFTYRRQHWQIKCGRPLLGLVYCRRLRPWVTGWMATYNVRVDSSCNNKIITIIIICNT